MTPASFDQVNEDHLNALLDLAPEVGTDLGLVERDDRWPDPSPGARSQTLACLRQWARALAAFPDASLNVGQRLDRKVFTAHLELVEFVAAERGRRAADPDLLSPVAATLQRQAEATQVPGEPRFTALKARLDGLEDYLAAARAQVGSGSVDALGLEVATAAAGGMATLLASLRDRAEQEGIPAALKADLEKAVTAASRQVDAQRAWLSGLSAAPADPVGAPTLAELCRLRHLPADLEELQELGRRYVVEYRAERRRFGKRLSPQDPVRGGRAKLREDAPGAFPDALARLDEVVHAARAFVQGQDLCPLPEGESITLGEMPALFLPGHPPWLYRAAPKFSRQQQGVLLLAGPALDGSPADLHQGVLEGLAVARGYPGQHLQQSVANLWTGLLRHGVPLGYYAGTGSAWAVDMVEGWAHYCEVLMREQGFRDHNAARFHLAGEGLRRAHQVLIDVGLATGTMTVDTAVGTLVNEVGLLPSAARSLVRRAARSPGLALGGLVGKHRLFELRRQAKIRWVHDFSLRRFHELVLSTGSVPVHFVASRLEPEPAH